MAFQGSNPFFPTDTYRACSTNAVPPGRNGAWRHGHGASAKKGPKEVASKPVTSG